MTREQAESSIAKHGYGEPWRIVPFACEGGHAIAMKIDDHDLWFILKTWDENIFEDMRTVSIASYAYPIVPSNDLGWA